MYLKDLTLRGFKSFASTTRFHFEPGITAIVGPNGSGKSNVVDALAWVMGEQGAKSLRGGNMADVIFAGSQTRPALGRAQVELTIDNSDGRLPIAYSEVTISRTMFRSGGSEYAINKQPVRLLDVQELLSDSGLGRQMHVIVGQGQLDAVLRASPLDRRAFIDEAAGVAKHRKRKERALRKLETMDQNLVRVLDLTEEIRRQLRPLARQAKAAREAAGVRARADYARSRLLAADLAESAARLEKEKAALAAMRSANAEAEGGARRLSQELSQVRGELARLTHLGEAAQERYRDFRELAGRLQATAELAIERGAAADRVPSAITDDAVSIAFERAQEAELEAKQAASAAEQAEAKLGEAQQGREEAQKRATSVRSELLRQQGAFQERLEAYRKFETGRERALANVAAAEQRVQASREAAAESEARLQALPQLPPEPAGQSRSPSQDAYESAAKEETAARARLEAQERAQSAATQSVARLSSQVETLARSLGRALKGPAGTWAREVAGVSPDGTLSELLTVQRGWEQAVEALLGTMDSARVLSQGTSTEQLLSQAGTNGYDGVTGLISQGKMKPSSLEGNDYGAPALAVTSVPETLSAALHELLGDCWVSESASSALTLLEAFPQLRLVATRGGVVFTRHSVHLPSEVGTSTITLRAEHSKAQEQADAAEEKLREVSLQTSEARSAFMAATARREAALEDLRASDAKRAEVAGERARVAALIHAGEAELERAKEAVGGAESSLEQARQVLAKIQELVTERPEPSEELLAQAQEELDQAEKTLEAKREEETTARMAAHVARERSRSMSAQSAAFTAQAGRLREERSQQLQRESSARQVGRAAKAIAERAAAGAERASEAASACEAERRELNLQRHEKQLAADRLQTRLAGSEAAQAGAREQLLQAEVAFAGRQGTHENAQLQVLSFLGLEAPSEPTLEWPSELQSQVDEFLRRFGPHNPWSPQGEDESVAFDRVLAGDALARAERQLARLGVVNPLAVEEHAALASRLEFLEGQVEDLGRSKADLLELVREVDNQVRESFIAAFADTADKFREVFQRLFPGGKGRLELTDPEDPLETGVEIFARPVGKKVTRLSLLSGGERSLAALAYLIAIFLARPSPFYVMDEVEAALDDTNLSRVLSLFEDLSKESQLLVITHQKRTMEIADALYGLSMKDGVTAVVSHKMEQ